MGLETQLFEIDPDSSLFGLLQADGEWAQTPVMLQTRHERPETCGRDRETKAYQE